MPEQPPAVLERERDPRSARTALITPARAARAFRVTAVVEAITWAGLLVGMAFKYVLSDNEIGVQVFGPLHGAAFIAYVAATVVAFRRLGWPRWLLVVGLLASIPPLSTWLFEEGVRRTGRLAEPTRDKR